MINLAEGNDPFVVFVGAGASALPPSYLPTWIGFNNLLLECLCEQLAEYSRNRQPTAEMLSSFQKRRDEMGFFAPDFQAQLVEEEVGADYFRVWKSLETDVWGPVHAGLAELASRGKLAAIVTTNFDRLIETALQERGQNFKVFHDRTAFEALPTIVGEARAAELPVIKIHGTITDETSLIDTLKQRLIGRPKPLMDALQILLRRHPWLYLGFSGADFDYDPHYLGILDAAAGAKGFLFLAQNGRPVKRGVCSLVEAYGAGKGSIAFGNLSTWLPDVFGLAKTSVEPAAENGKTDVDLRVKHNIRQWTANLGPIAVVNIVYSMLKSSGMERDALWLMRKTWKSYRTPDDTSDKSYAQYNYNYGVALLEVGLIRNPIPLTENMNNLSEWREHADRNAYEFLSRSYRSGKLVAGAQLACVMAYRGQVGKAMELADAVADQALAGNATLELCDVAIAGAVIADIVQIFGPTIEQLHRCLNIAKELGDEPRRAMLCAQLGRFLIYRKRFDEAARFLVEADSIARRLALQSVLLASQAARGLWLLDSGASVTEAVLVLQDLVQTIHALDDVPLVTKVDMMRPESEPTIIKGQHPILCRALLNLMDAAIVARNGEVLNQTIEELDVLVTDVFRGYCPHYFLNYAGSLLNFGEKHQRALIPDLIQRARQVGEECGNPWVPQQADYVERLAGLRP